MRGRRCRLPRRSGDDSLTQLMSTFLEVLGQFVVCQHHRGASGRRRPRTSVRFQETVALQTPRQRPCMEHSEWIQGSKLSCEHKWVYLTAMWEDVDQWSSQRKRTDRFFKATLEHRSSLRTTKKAIRSTGADSVCRLRATRHARGIGQIEIRDQGDLFVRTRLGQRHETS